MTEDLGNNAVFTPGGLSDGPPIGDVEREAVSSLGGYPMLLGHCCPRRTGLNSSSLPMMRPLLRRANSDLGRASPQCCKTLALAPMRWVRWRRR